MSWTPEREAQLRKLWGEGLSISQIAKQMGGGLTRNSVAGKVDRLMLPPRRRAHWSGLDPVMVKAMRLVLQDGVRPSVAARRTGVRESSLSARICEVRRGQRQLPGGRAA